MNEQPDICISTLLAQRQKEGKPLLVLQPSSASADVVRTLRAMLPAHRQNAVVLVDLSTAGHTPSFHDEKEKQR